MRRRDLLAAPLLLPALGRAQPAADTRTVRVVVPYAPGGSSDIVARFVTAAATAASGVPFAVENRGGGASIPGTQAVIAAPPDGLTAGITDIALAINPGLFGPRLPYDTDRDLAPVGLISTAPIALLAHPDAPARDVAALIAAAKARPGSLALGHAGNGTANHLASVLFALTAGLEVTQVAYRGGGPLVTAVATGEVPYGFGAVPAAMGQVSGGRMRALAVTSAARSPALPEVPSLAEVGLPDATVEVFNAAIAPAATPPAALDRLNALLVQTAKEPALAARLAGLGYTVVASTRQAFGETLRADIARWRAVIRRAEIAPE